MKKKTRNIILILIGVIVILFLVLTIYGNYNLENDKRTLNELISKANNEELKAVFDTMEDIESFQNPKVNAIYQKWKKKMNARFITKDETFENTSGNKIVNDISNIYREYWRAKLLKEYSLEQSDSLLFSNLTNYLVSNNLTPLTKDSLSQTISNSSELKRIIEGEGFKTRFLYLNGFWEVLIWDKEFTNTYNVTLPKDTINATVVFIENFHLNTYDDYATFGYAQVGGWAIKETATLYCNKSDYDLNSEKFKISFLKHESFHFIDLNKYTNLSPADLEYRAKIIELMFCTKKTIYDRISDFLNGANSTNRDHSHPYANYSLIKNLSELLFNSDYESDLSKWKQLSVEDINNAAESLYKISEEVLHKDNDLVKII